MTLQELIVKVSTDLTGLKTEDATAKFAKMGSDIDSILGGIGGKIAASLSIAAVAAEAIHGAEVYEQALLRIQRATGTAGTALDALGESFKNVYSNSAASAEAVTQALTLIYQRTGATGEALEDLTLKLLKLAKVSGEDIKGMGNAVTAMFANWKMGADEQANSLNYLTALFQKTAVSVTDTATEVSKYGATLRALGYDFDSAAALVAKFGKEGVNTQAIIMGMKAEMARFQKEGITDTAAAWADFVKGVQSGAITMANVLAQVGKKGGPELFAAIKEGRIDVANLTKETEAAAKSTSTSVTSMTAEWTKLKHSTEMALEPLGAPFLGMLAEALSGVAKFTQQAGKLLQDFYNAQKRASEDKDLPWYGQPLAAFLGAGASVAGRLLGSGQAPGTGTAGADAAAAAAGMKQEQEAANALSPALATLVEKHKELKDAVDRARALVEEARAAFAQHRISSDDLRAAQENLKKAVEALTGAHKDQLLTHKQLALSVTELLEKQRLLDAEVQKAQAVFDAVQKLYEAGKISVDALVRAQEQLESAIKAATGAAITWQEVYRGIIADQEKGNDTAYATGRAYMEIAKNFVAGSGAMIEAHAKMDAAFRSTGTTGLEIWKQLVAEAGGYVVEVINGGQKTQQVMGLSQKEAKALSEILSTIKGQTHENTAATTTYVNTVSSGRNAWDSVRDGIDGARESTRGLADEMNDFYSVLLQAAIAADSFEAKLAKAQATFNPNAGGPFHVEPGTFLPTGASPTPSMTLGNAFDPMHPEQGGWSAGGSQLGTQYVNYIPPSEPSNLPPGGRWVKKGGRTVYRLGDQWWDQDENGPFPWYADTAGGGAGSLSIGMPGYSSMEPAVTEEQAKTTSAIEDFQQMVEQQYGDLADFLHFMDNTVANGASGTQDAIQGLGGSFSEGFTDLGSVLKDTATALVSSVAAVAGAITGDLSPRVFLPGSMDMPLVSVPVGAGGFANQGFSEFDWQAYVTGQQSTVNVNVYDRSGADSVVRLIQERL
jgi:hypothetical protein